MIMKIAIMGAGNVGRALAANWTRGGHEVVFGGRNPAGSVEGTPVKAIAEAAQGADAIVLATPYEAAFSVLEALGGAAGRVVIDATNPLHMVDGALALSLGHTTSAAEELHKAAPQARIVKTLNQTGAENMADPSRLSGPAVMYVASDDDDAKAVATALVTDLGFSARDGGPLATARLLEPLAMLWIDQALIRGAGRAWAFATV